MCWFLDSVKKLVPLTLRQSQSAGRAATLRSWWARGPVILSLFSFGDPFHLAAEADGRARVAKAIDFMMFIFCQGCLFWWILKKSQQGASKQGFNL